MDMRYIHAVQDNDYSHSHIPNASVINNNETNTNMGKESIGHTSLTYCKQHNVTLDYLNKLHQHHPQTFEQNDELSEITEGHTVHGTKMQCL